MALRANFHGVPTEEAAQVTIEWLTRTGITSVASWQELYDHHPIYIQLHVVPEVLSYFNQLEDEVSIAQVSSEGISFYVTDIPLWASKGNKEQKVESERADGFIFCPMSNVVCINTFGALFGHVPEA